MSTSYGRALVFFSPELHREGWILDATGALLEECRHNSFGLEDHNTPRVGRPAYGLAIFEGFLHVDRSEDPDVYWKGEWRPLTHWELVRVRSGQPPWEQTP